jgi:hypothetical protein
VGAITTTLTTAPNPQSRVYSRTRAAAECARSESTTRCGRAARIPRDNTRPARRSMPRLHESLRCRDRPETNSDDQRGEINLPHMPLPHRMQAVGRDTATSRWRRRWPLSPTTEENSWLDAQASHRIAQFGYSTAANACLRETFGPCGAVWDLRTKLVQPSS